MRTAECGAVCRCFGGQGGRGGSRFVDGLLILCSWHGFTEHSGLKAVRQGNNLEGRYALRARPARVPPRCLALLNSGDRLATAEQAEQGLTWLCKRLSAPSVVEMPRVGESGVESAKGWSFTTSHSHLSFWWVTGNAERLMINVCQTIKYWVLLKADERSFLHTHRTLMLHICIRSALQRLILSAAHPPAAAQHCSAGCHSRRS